jgi:hypothetical protein
MLASTRLPAKTGYRQLKSAKFAAHSAQVASFHPVAIASGPHQRLMLFTLKTMFLPLLRSSKILILFLSTQSSEW